MVRTEIRTRAVHTAAIEGCRRANGLLMASSTLERYLMGVDWCCRRW